MSNTNKKPTADSAERAEFYGRKRKKNYTVLACLAGFIALIWAITMVKMGLQ